MEVGAGILPLLSRVVRKGNHITDWEQSDRQRRASAKSQCREPCIALLQEQQGVQCTRVIEGEVGRN